MFQYVDLCHFSLKTLNMILLLYLKYLVTPLLCKKKISLMTLLLYKHDSQFQIQNNNFLFKKLYVYDKLIINTRLCRSKVLIYVISMFY